MKTFRPPLTMLIALLWIFGTYLIYTEFQSQLSRQDQVFKDYIRQLENEVISLKQNLSDIQSER